MRIVSKAELKAMPKGTPFAEFHPNGSWPQGFDIFVADCGYIDDFYYRSINTPLNSGSSDLSNRETEMHLAGTAYPIDCGVDREGYYDPDIRYLVWEPDDVSRIIALLQGGDVDDAPGVKESRDMIADALRGIPDAPIGSVAEVPVSVDGKRVATLTAERDKYAWRYRSIVRYQGEL